MAVILAQLHHFPGLLHGNNRCSTEQRLDGVILGTLNHLSLNALLTHDRDIHLCLHHAVSTA
uniref:Putative ovule protein n=1 Tax=Solanum chacoense TaxID=4108 RepID=A0A0V0GE50_SOLCH